MIWHALILALVLTPDEPCLPAQASPAAWQALKDIAWLLEIVGPHESWASDFGSELRYVRRHWRLLQDAPPLADCYWLPAPEVARQMCCFNEAYQTHLSIQQFVFPYRSEQFAEMLAETRRLHGVWDAVRRANTPHETWALRRRMLLRLRDAIGEEAYYQRRLPSWVPWWHFQPLP